MVLRIDRRKWTSYGSLRGSRLWYRLIDPWQQASIRVNPLPPSSRGGGSFRNTLKPNARIPSGSRSQNWPHDSGLRKWSPPRNYVPGKGRNLAGPESESYRSRTADVSYLLARRNHPAERTTWSESAPSQSAAA